jgi:hypothetical protein
LRFQLVLSFENFHIGRVKVCSHQKGSRERVYPTTAVQSD